MRKIRAKIFFYGVFMKRFLIVFIAGVLSANAPLDSTADSAIGVDSQIDSSANTDLDLADTIPPPPRSE